ncbi:MAG: hypothetical protein K0R05_1416 [Anaerocolumna sp.]|nr:hypothetical protein [Anaerocolumna sp.]
MVIIRQDFLRPELQAEVGIEGYDKGAKLLVDFFKDELVKFKTDELDPLGREIIDCFFNNGSLEDYGNILPMRY